MSKITSAGIGGWNNRRKIRIKNFRSIVMEDFIELKPITLLFGKNGAGKSSFIKAIKFLGQNLFPITTEQTIYNIDHNIDLGNFRELVFKQNINEEIQINYEEFWENFTESEGDRESKIINYRLNTNFRFCEDEKNLKSVSIEDIVNNFSFVLEPYKINPISDSIILEIISSKLTYEEQKDILEFKFKEGYAGYPNKALDIERSFVSKDLKEFDTTFKTFIKYLDILPFTASNNNYPQTYYRQLINYLWSETEESKRNVADFIINHFIKDIPTLAKKFFNHWYVTPVRERPRSKYKLSGNKFNGNEYYGILSQVDKQNEEYHRYYPGNNSDILKFINDSLISLGLGKKFIIRKDKGFGSAYIKDLQGLDHNLAESSSGLIQIIPIIVATFNALYEYADFVTSFDKDYATEVVIIEQPELHLHPSLQAKLTEFISKGNGTYIIETHSEHMVRKLQVLIAQGKLSKEKVAVYYFDKDGKTGITSIKEMEMEENGFFKEPWPDEFFDDSFNLSMELLTAKRN